VHGGKVDAVIEAVLHFRRKSGLGAPVGAAVLPFGLMLVDRINFGRLKAERKFILANGWNILPAPTWATRQVAQRNGADVVISGESAANQDHLEGAPVV
jgi:hypothetical protein